MKVFILVVVIALSLAEDDLRLAADDPVVLQALFSKFRSDNSRDYASPQEARVRLRTFRKFVKEAARLNEEQDDIKVGITFFADMTEEEKMSYHGANLTDIGDESEVETIVPEALSAPASQVSHKHRYGPIKNQGSCGSCWAYGAVGVTEGFQHMRTGSKVPLSEQHVLSCSGAGNCARGGYHSRALSWIRSKGRLATQSSYRYTARDGQCYSNWSNGLRIRIQNTYQISRGDNNLANAINAGPVAVLLYNFHGVGIEGYLGGIMKPKVEQGPGAMNHIVVAVGYSQYAWELRNSWGSRWGNAGYFDHSRSKYNNIGVSDHAYTMNAVSAGLEEEE